MVYLLPVAWRYGSGLRQVVCSIGSRVLRCTIWSVSSSLLFLLKLLFPERFYFFHLEEEFKLSVFFLLQLIPVSPLVQELSHFVCKRGCAIDQCFCTLYIELFSMLRIFLITTDEYYNSAILAVLQYPFNMDTVGAPHLNMRIWEKPVKIMRWTLNRR
jgi:hypothetical protein